jgi:hypothetical protein
MAVCDYSIGDEAAFCRPLGFAATCQPVTSAYALSAFVVATTYINLSFIL